jgi:hypothetical protein
MKRIYRLLDYLLFTFIGLIIFSVSVLAHLNGNDWHGHMPWMGEWGWPVMLIFWVIGILIIVLLVVTITKILKK